MNHLQAKEVVRLLTPDKELPPLPLEEAPPAKESARTSDIGSSIESSLSPHATAKHAAAAEDAAVGKLDSLVYNRQQQGPATAEAEVILVTHLFDFYMYMTQVTSLVTFVTLL